ncbi:hypothetical protein BGZ76_011010 [Entomortierella beljakovae]|nr:hypothetical protein BGZ76_011010 [Entomortierella beljakovae]
MVLPTRLLRPEDYCPEFQIRFKGSIQESRLSDKLDRKETAKGYTSQGIQHDAKDDNRLKDAVENTDKKFHPARLPIVLCHGFSGFDTLGVNADFCFDYWHGVREALTEIGCDVYTARVPPFAGIQQRAEKLEQFMKENFAHGTELNLVGHSMGGLDCRYLISQLKSPHFKVKSLTTLATPHRGSSFADYFFTDVVGQVRLETFWKLLSIVGIDRRAAENLSTFYLQDEFNSRTLDDPDVKYFSYGASYQPGLFSRFRFSWNVIMEREGPNDGLVSVQSAKWGTYVRTIQNADHMDLMNWVNTLAWSRARFPWILGGSTHDPEGRLKGAFEVSGNNEKDQESPSEEKEDPLFNAIELYLEISDLLYKNGL